MTSILVKVSCPHCQSDEVVRCGKTATNKQRFSCKNVLCHVKTFIVDYSYKGRQVSTQKAIIEMSLNSSGIRDISRVLGVSTATVIKILKKKEGELESINRKLLEALDPREVTVEIVKVEEVELDEMWSFVGNKNNQRWLWHAIDHQTGKVLAYVLGRRKDEVFLKLKQLLEPFGIQTFYTDDWGAYDRHLEPENHKVGKRNTQKIERKHLTLRTRIKRLARKTICFSKSIQMHDILIGLFVNRYEFGIKI